MTTHATYSFFYRAFIYRRFGVDLTKIPKCYQVYEYLNTLEEFVRAHPDQQPDSPPKA